MKTSENGLKFIKTWEGVKLIAYLDVIGKLTVGCGHLVRPEDNIKLGQKITQTQVDEFLRADIVSAENAVNELVKVELNQNQFDALVSFVFNLGRGNLAKSTLLKILNKGKYEYVPAQFGKWCFAGGRKINGLVKRRKAESDLFKA